MEFVVGATFLSWKEFFDAFELYKSSTYQPFVTASTRTTEAANKRNKLGNLRFPERFQYAYIEYQCTHRGCYKSTGQGQRKASSFKSGCPAKVYASVDKLAEKIVVRSIVSEHNHETSQALYAHYPMQRLLQKKDEADLAGLCKLKVSSKMLRQHVKDIYDKNLSLKDVTNIKSRTRACDKIVDGIKRNDAQLLLKRVQEEKAKDPAATVDIGVREDGTLNHFFFQSSNMKSVFAKFPEHILVDCTYCVNDRQMPLLTFMCVDGNLESHVIALALISEESKGMLYSIFDILRKQNPCTDKLQTFMVDKDMNEISCLQTVFPHATIELCLFHVQKAMKKKINELTCDKKVKDLLRECCTKLCYAKSEEEYKAWKDKLVECEEFFSYFIDHWDSMREKWVQFERAKHLNFSNRTNNRLESYHQKLKSEVPRNAPLDVMFDNILLVLEALKNEVTHRQFQNAMKQSSCTRFPCLQKQLTPFAFSQAMGEFDKAVNLRCVIKDECVVVLDGGIRVVRDNVCDCSAFASKCLPCRHVIASCIVKDMPPPPPPLDISMFSSRWLRCNQEISAQSAGGVNVSVCTSSSASGAWSKAKKFNMAKVVAFKIVDKMSELGMPAFCKYLEQLRQFDKNISLLSDGGDDVGKENGSRVEITVDSGSINLVCSKTGDVIVDSGRQGDGVDCGMDDEMCVDTGRHGVSEDCIRDDESQLRQFDKNISMLSDGGDDVGKENGSGVEINVDSGSGGINLVCSKTGDVIVDSGRQGDGVDCGMDDEMCVDTGRHGVSEDCMRDDENRVNSGWEVENCVENDRVIECYEDSNFDFVIDEDFRMNGGASEDGVDSHRDCSVVESSEDSILQELIKYAKPPGGLGKRGRPKGAGLTVLGMERKERKRVCNKKRLRLNKGDGLCPAKKRFRSEQDSVSGPNSIFNSPTTMARSEFFALAQDLLSSCKSFSELCLVAASLSKSMTAYPLPKTKVRTIEEVGDVDNFAHKLLTEVKSDYCELLTPVKIVGDGNCVPRSLSVFCFGDQDHYKEIRCRIVIEQATRPHDYMNLSSGELHLLCQFSDCLSSTPMETFQNETLKVSKNSAYMGVWQLMAAANIFNTPIHSVYPPRGPDTVLTLFNRIIDPFRIPSPSSPPKCVLLWCAKRNMKKVCQ